MLNHYLSKPAEYKIPAHMIFAIQRVTQSLKAADALAADLSAQVISEDERLDFDVGRLDSTIREAQQLKRKLMGRRR